MTIFRGPGGTGSATSDSDTTEFQEFLVQSQVARDAAVAAKVAAELAETNAETAETNAETAETNAETAATSAASSATSATNSATAAASSASAASTSATNASASASSASTSATAAASSASSAATSASNAATSATNAASSATSASSSATAATTQATNAAASATSAASSASSASTSATNAASSASSASTSASNAATSATSAASSATSAANSATAAATSAIEAANTVASTVKLTGDQTIAGTKTFSSNPILSAGTANGVAYLNGSKVLTTGSALTFDGTNLNLGGTAQRITGDFSNATIANRMAFQTSTVNGNTVVGAIPNGSASTTVFRAFNVADPTNSSQATFGINAGAVLIDSAIQGTGTYLPMTFFTGGSERMRLDTSGNVGIGTSAPSQKLQVAASTNQLSLTTGTNELIVRASSTEAALYTFQAIPLSFYTNNAERMRIDSSGNLGIGTSSPGTKLQAQGVITAQGTDITNELLVADAHGGFVNSSAVALRRDGVNMGKVDADYFQGMRFYVTNGSGAAATEQAKITTAGLFQFNSGYGSVATAYGCRAWVNFNGTGTVAIRASGNVSSITDNGTGNYTVNFTTAMPDSNFSPVSTAAENAGVSVIITRLGTLAVSSSQIFTVNRSDGGLADSATIAVAIFR